MNKAVLTSLVLLAAIVTGGALYYVSSQEYVLRFSENQIQEKLSSKLPMTKTYLVIFQVTLDHPRVRLDNGSNRVNAGLDVSLNMRIGKDSRPLGGAIDVSGAIRYFAESGEFFLTEPIVEQVAVQGIPEKFADKLNSILQKAMTEYYADHPIYTLHATDTKTAVAKLVLKNVIVENRELVLTLGL